MTLQDFVKLCNASLVYDRISNRTDQHDMPEGSAHYLCLIKTQLWPKGEAFFYSKGPGLRTKIPGGYKPTPPTLIELLGGLRLDYCCGFQNTFEQFCLEYGYDDDSIKAKKIYDACVETGVKLRRLFGRNIEHLITADEN